MNKIKICNIKIKLLIFALLVCFILTFCISCTVGGGGDDQTDTSGTAPDTSASADDPVPDPTDLSDVDLTEYLTLDYSGITVYVDRLSGEITDDVLDSELRAILVHYGKYTLNTSRTAVAGDYAVITYQGIFNGERPENMRAEKEIILLDDEKSGFLTGFASGLVGKKAGDKVTLDLVYPESDLPEYSGKPVTFEVTVDGVCDAELTDAIAAELSEGAQTTAAAYRAHLKEYLAEADRAEMFSRVYDLIWDELTERATVISYPAELYTYRYMTYVSSMKQLAESYHISYAELLKLYGYTDDDLTGFARRDCLSDMIVYYIANAEGLNLTDEEYRSYLDTIISDYRDRGYNVTAEEVEKSFAEQFGTGYLRRAALDEKVVHWVYERTEIAVKVD